MSKLTLPFLETMITQACNLSCVGCTNYSDLNFSGYVPWNNGKKDLESWLEILDIPDFGIMGGEPLINPEVKLWLSGVRALMPDTQIRFTTNGTLLHKHLDIIDLAHSLGNIVFKITVHQHTKIIEDTIKYIFKKFKWEPVNEYGIDRYRTSNNLRFQINRPEKFILTYKNSYTNMKPYNNNPVESFDICVQKTCPLLYQGSIYKCSTQGLLKDLLYKLDIKDAIWDKFLVPGISIRSDKSAINEFIDNFNKPHNICAMCPTKKDTNASILHYKNVTNKKGSKL